MAKSVLITIRSIMSDGQEAPYEISTTCSGTMSMTKAGVTLQYRDQLDDDSSPPTPRDVTVKILSDRVEMYQKGDYSIYALVFMQGRRSDLKYHTAYGDMEMAVFTTRLAMKTDPLGGHVSVQYSLESGGQFMHAVELELHYAVVDGIRA